MKQKVTTIVAIILILIFVNVNIVGCTATNQFSDVLDKETTLAIKTGYVNYRVEQGYISEITVADVNIKQFYGVYNGSAVVEIYGDKGLDAIGWYQAAGIDFAYEGEIITVYNSGQRYWLLEAYEMGLLSKNDLIKISEKNKQLYPDLYLNQPVSDVLDEETELAIKTGYVNYCVEQGYIPDITVSDVIIKNFYGIYHDSAVVEIYGDKGLDAIGWFRVAGIDFAYENEIISVYNSGQRYSLYYAYEMGLLSKKDLKKINERNKQLYPDLYLNQPVPLSP